MRKLVAGRPSSVPVGLGNSTTPIDMSAYGNNTPSGTEPNDSDASVTEPRDDDDNDNDNDDDEVPSIASIIVSSKKRKSGAVEDADKPSGKKTKARKSVSAPAKVDSGGSKSSKKPKAENQFAELARDEETTKQAELRLARVKVEVALRKVNGKVDMSKNRGELKLRMMEMKLRHEIEMKRMELSMAHNFSQPSSPYRTSSTANTFDFAPFEDFSSNTLLPSPTISSPTSMSMASTPHEAEDSDHENSSGLSFLTAEERQFASGSGTTHDA
jgi:hypothetical protein